MITQIVMEPEHVLTPVETILEELNAAIDVLVKGMEYNPIHD